VSAADWRKMMGMAEPKLELKKVASSRLGVLTSGDAYVITCQTGYLVAMRNSSSSSSSSQSAAKSVAAAALAAGSAAVKTEVIMETVLYLWLGQDYPLRDELRSKVSTANPHCVCVLRSIYFHARCHAPVVAQPVAIS
jgi:hypothetical protein